MAIEVIQQRWCDWHLRVGVSWDGDTHEPGEHVEAVEYQVAFGPSAHNALPMTVDLCEDCMHHFGDAIMELVTTLALKKQAKRESTAEPLGGGKKVSPLADCPVDGCNYHGRAGGMKGHVESVHKVMIGQVAYVNGVTFEGSDVRYACKDHEDGAFGFARPQAISQHLIQGHKMVAGSFSAEDYLLPKKEHGKPHPRQIRLAEAS